MTKQKTETKNQMKRLRRSKTNAENANVNKGNGQQLKLNRAEQAILGETNKAQASADNNRKLIDGLQANYSALDGKMANYDATDVRPRFETIEKKLDLLLNLVLQVDQEFDISDDEMKLLGLEEDKEELREEDSHAEE